MSLEQDLKDTFARREGDVAVRPDSWGGIERGVRRAKRARIATYSASSVALLTAIALVLVLVRDTTKPFDFAAASANATTYRVRAVSTVQQGNQRVSRSLITGEVDVERGVEHLISTLERSTSPSVSPRGPFRIEFILTKTAAYFRPPTRTPELGPSGKHWIRETGDMSQLLATAGGQDSILNPLAGPGEYFDRLQRISAAVRSTGREHIRGIATTRYQVTVDVEKLIASLPADERDGVKQTFNESGSTFSMTVWVGNDGFLYRASYSLKIKMDESIVDGVSHVTFGNLGSVVDFYDYGRPLSIHIPAASDTLDAGNLTGLGGSLLGLGDLGAYTTSRTFTCTGHAAVSAGSGASTPAPVHTTETCSGSKSGIVTPGR